MANQDGLYTDLGGGQWAQNMQLTGSNASDTKTQGNGDVNALHSGYNGVTWDRWRNNTQGILLASAARTVTNVTPVQTNYNARGVMIFLNVTAVGGAGGLQLFIQGVEPVTTVGKTLNATPTTVTATGTYMYIIYPGSSGPGSGALAQNTAIPLPRQWSVYMNHVDATSYTYSLAYSLIL